MDKLEEFARWLVSLDEPGSEERRTVTLTKIIDRARAALRHRPASKSRKITVELTEAQASALIAAANAFHSQGLPPALGMALRNGQAAIHDALPLRIEERGHLG